MFYTIRQQRRFKYSSLEQAWLPVALYDSENHYRGAAYFTDKAKAEAYLEQYSESKLSTRAVYLSKRVVSMGPSKNTGYSHRE